MAALYENLLGGTITDAPLTSGATTINSSAFQFLPEVVAPAFMFVTLDPAGANGLPEIVKVTAHAASATSVTVVRGQQDTVQREHPVSAAWIHGLTEADVDEFLKVVATADITDAAVTTAKLGDGAVTGPKLGADSVDGSKIADDAINSEHYAAGSVDPEHLATAAVTGVKIADGAVTEAKLAAAAVSTAKVADSAVTTAKVADGAVVEAKLGAGSVTTAKVADSAVTTAKVADGAVTLAKLAADSVDSSKIVDGGVATADLADGSVTEAKIGAGAVTTAKIADDSVTQAKLAPAVDTQLSNLPAQFRAGRTAVTTNGSGDATISFGFTFSATPAIVATVERTSTSQNACHIVGLSPTGFTVRVTANDVTLTSTLVAIHWHAAVM